MPKKMNAPKTLTPAETVTLSADLDQSVVYAIQRLYKTDKHAHDLFKTLATRTNTVKATPITSIMSMVSISRQEAVDLLKRLETTGIGRFIAGRLHYPSRMEWYFQVAAIGKAAMKAPGKLEDIPVEKVPLPVKKTRDKPEETQVEVPQRTWAEALEHSQPQPKPRTEATITVDEAKAQLAKAMGIPESQLIVSIKA